MASATDCRRGRAKRSRNTFANVGSRAQSVASPGMTAVRDQLKIEKAGHVVQGHGGKVSCTHPQRQLPARGHVGRWCAGSCVRSRGAVCTPIDTRQLAAAIRKTPRGWETRFGIDPNHPRLTNLGSRRAHAFWVTSCGRSSSTRHSGQPQARIRQCLPDSRFAMGPALVSCAASGDSPDAPRPGA
jgi:hypothetical protein